MVIDFILLDLSERSFFTYIPLIPTNEINFNLIKYYLKSLSLNFLTTS